ncbi:MAG: DUF4867 family protein [Spirochaetes bacterium]|nr:DUF4867 family protein [Spirochaetota bacterium]
MNKKIKFNYNIKIHNLDKISHKEKKIFNRFLFFHKPNNYEYDLIKKFNNYLKIFPVSEKRVYYIPSIINNLNDSIKNYNSLPSDNSEKNEIIKYLEELNNHFQKYYFGKINTQCGICYGYNKYLNSLEFHKTNEIIISLTPQILVLGDLRNIDLNNNKGFNINDLQAFYISENTILELFSTTLHFAPISLKENPFYSLIVLPENTNLSLQEDLKEIRKEIKDKISNGTEKIFDYNYFLFAKNKWLFTHRDSPQFKMDALEFIKTKERLQLID